MEVDAVEVPRVARGQDHVDARVAELEAGPVRRALSEHRSEIFELHRETEGAVHLQERRQQGIRARPERRIVVAPAARLRLLRRLEPEPRDDRGAERADVFLALRLGVKLDPELDVGVGVLVVSAIEAGEVPGEARQFRDVHALGHALRANGEDLEERLPGEQASRPRPGLVHRRVGVPRPRPDVREEGVEIIRRERRVRVVESVPPLRLPVHEAPPERRLHVVGVADAPGEVSNLVGHLPESRPRLAVVEPLERLAHRRVHRPIPLAALDVLRRPRLERVPVGALQHRPARRRGRGDLSRRGGLRLRRAPGRPRRGGLHRPAPALGAEARERVRRLLRLRADALAEHRRRLPSGNHPGGELGDERPEAGVLTLGRARARSRLLRVGRRAAPLGILRVRDLGVVRGGGGELVLLPAAPRRVRRLRDFLPLPEARLEPAVRDDALEPRLVRLGPLRALELVAHEVRGLAVEDAHVLRPEPADDVDELVSSLARVPGDAHAHVSHVRVAVERGRRGEEHAVVHGDERARPDARLEPVPRDDALVVERRALVEVLVLGGGLEHDVRHRRGIVLALDPAAEAPDGLDELIDGRLVDGVRVLVVDVVKRQAEHERIHGLVHLQRGRRGGDGHRLSRSKGRRPKLGGGGERGRGARGHGSRERVRLAPARERLVAFEIPRACSWARAW